MSVRTEEERSYYAFQRRAWPLFAPFYDTLVSGPFGGLRREVVRVAALPPDSRLLDVATGTGAQAFAFAGRVNAVVGIDMSEAMLRIARRKNRFSNVTFEQADASALPFENESFDASCVSFALHEMPASIRERVLREMARVTKAGGSVIMVDYALPAGSVSSWLAFRAIKLYEGEHYVSFVRSDIASLFEAARIEVRERHVVLKGVGTIVVGQRLR